MTDGNRDTSKRPTGRHEGRRGGREARVRKRKDPRLAHSPQGPDAGAYKPLSQGQLEQVLDGAHHLLETIGMGLSGEPPPAARCMLENGARLSEQERILVPRGMVEDTLAKTPSSWTLHASDPERSIEIAPGRLHFGTAGGAVMILGLMQSEYRYPALSDRQSIVEWEEDGRQDMAERARAYTKRILPNHHPVHISVETDDKIRAAFDIRLSKEAIGQG